MEVSAPVFHPAKKRKFLRARHTDSEERNTEATGDSSSQIGSWPPSAARSPGENEEQDDGDGAPISDIIRLRKSQKSRRAGIGFSANDKSSGGQQSSALVPAEQDVEKHQILGMEDRFTGHTGQKVDVDKHMYVPPLFTFSVATGINEIRMAYIDSEMAKRQVQSDPDGCAETTVDGDGNVQRMAEVHLPQRQPASLGKLHEIDLGPDAKLRNIQRTEAATRILAGRESPTPSDGELPPRKGDGKPWRGRKRRNSDDIRRDQLVEEVLRESKRKESPCAYPCCFVA